MSAALTVIESGPRAGALQVVDPIPTLDTAQFEHMLRVAKVMANATLIPDSLCKDKDGNWLAAETILSNCFLVTNQAVRWGMDPFAVAQCASVVHGRLMWEGKLVQAVIESKLPDADLNTSYDGTGMDRTITVTGLVGSGKVRTVVGSVKDWLTRKKNGDVADAWVRQADDMLHYRGMRQWARRWAPALMLGVYTPDEMDDLAEAAREERAHPVRRAPPAPPPAAAIAPPAPAQAAPITEESLAEAAEPAVVRRPPPPPGAAQAAPEPARERTRADDLEDMRLELEAATTADEFDAAAEPWLAAMQEWSRADREAAQGVYEAASGRFG